MHNNVLKAWIMKVRPQNAPAGSQPQETRKEQHKCEKEMQRQDNIWHQWLHLQRFVSSSGRSDPWHALVKISPSWSSADVLTSAGLGRVPRFPLSLRVLEQFKATPSRFISVQKQRRRSVQVLPRVFISQTPVERFTSRWSRSELSFSASGFLSASGALAEVTDHIWRPWASYHQINSGLLPLHGARADPIPRPFDPASLEPN